ncbi:V-set and immunoglobulin domain-containing protein 10-like [Echeneis naucrates]|uniref:Ig-like domain-containing protein n=1 Tax=Echeneis naucrates TaxID=173247 RepID=A0A665UU60_ECHNA|nr:V-set and immunoglobulin domain-containing protein 10-like [Echeneis naucrates]
MTRFGVFGRVRSIFLATFLTFSFQGAYCELGVSPAGPSLVNTKAGSNVTLAVRFSGALDPAVTWFKGNLPVVTWTVGSSAAPDISHREVLRIESDGSLTFVNVPLNYTGIYTIEITKSGMGKAATSFTLGVFETIENLEVSMQPSFVKEGTEQFTLRYKMSQGVVEQQMWFFNGREIETSLHFSIKQSSLVVFSPNRNDTGQYTALLTNPFSRVRAHFNVTVRYGPDEPVVKALPAQPFYVSGDSLSLRCQAEGFPQPIAEWVFGGETLSQSTDGVLNRTNIQTSQGGIYTCRMFNEETEEKRQKNITLSVYEMPSSSPKCSVHSVNGNVDLLYGCQWQGGTPKATLSFPDLSSGSGVGNFSLVLQPASADLNGKTVICMAVHPVQSKQCNITARSPRELLPAVRTTVDSEGKIVVAILCVSEASPEAVVSWSEGSKDVTNSTSYQISNDTTQLNIRHYNVSNFLLQNYTCICRNPLGSQRREIQLQGPLISHSSVFPNEDGTIITLTWEVPPRSVVTGFDIQLKGPDLNQNRIGIQNRSTSNKYRTIQQKPGSARSTDIFIIDPSKTRFFRVVPRALMTVGEPSESHRRGPAQGLSGPAIAGIAAGIPCSLLFLLLVGALIYLCVYCNKNQSRQTRYPVSRAVEKTITTQSDLTPHNLLTGELKSPPDYNRLHQTPSERSVALPTFVPPPPVRVATTV